MRKIARRDWRPGPFSGAYALEPESGDVAPGPGNRVSCRFLRDSKEQKMPTQLKQQHIGLSILL
ncbi:MAG TPA: hypothetical protein VFW91_17435, partial [Candidatus Binatia bacterium]|nr:hypothetical protein [Candidatus Binatia bacterium]